MQLHEKDCCLLQKYWVGQGLQPRPQRFIEMAAQQHKCSETGSQKSKAKALNSKIH